MTRSEFISVLTGDLIGYTQSIDGPENYLKNLEAALKLVSRSYSFNFQIFRGDSFQGILLDPSRSLEVALLLRSFLLSLPHTESDDAVQNMERPGDEKRKPTSNVKGRYDARISIGIGSADFYDLNRIGQSDGAAFRASGLGLDELKKRKRNLSIVTPWDEYNNELEVECALLDVIISKWTGDQALAVFYALQGMNQCQMAERLGRTQSGISQRLSKAGYWAIERMLANFNEKVNQN